MTNNLSRLIEYEPAGSAPARSNSGKLRGFLMRVGSALEMQGLEKEERLQMGLARQLRKGRVRGELEDAGLSHFDLAHLEARHLNEYLHSDEHVYAAIRGYNSKVGSMLIAATNMRILYLHILPLLTDVEEVPYALVSGIRSSNIDGLWSSVTLQTRAQDFIVNYVKPRAAHKFVDFIEKATIDTPILVDAPAVA